ncbi:MAG: alpha/beta hydrolase family esterase [Actinomycetota bacterium]
MASRRASPISAWFGLARTALKASEKLGKATRRHGPSLKKSAERLLSGVATPAAPPVNRGTGRWEEGRWGLGPFAMRRYRLFIPPGAGLRRPVPLVMLLHGCGQDAASFAAVTRAAANGRAGNFAVLLPEQAPEANPQRCWNWFRPEPVVAMEAGILAAIVAHVCALHPLRRDRVFALGLSAGGAMTVSLALRYPELLAAVGTHSGALPGSAENALQAGQSMGGRRSPDLADLRRKLAGRPLPPLIAIHGDRDHAVAPANAESLAELWLNLSQSGGPLRRISRETRTGKRRPYMVTDWTLDGNPYVRLIRVHGLGHAWSGGPAHQAFSDPNGPDALKLAWRFFRRCVE